jgi:hypothetical protein
MKYNSTVPQVSSFYKFHDKPSVVKVASMQER